MGQGQTLMGNKGIFIHDLYQAFAYILFTEAAVMLAWINYTAESVVYRDDSDGRVSSTGEISTCFF